MPVKGSVYAEAAPFCEELRQLKEMVGKAMAARPPHLQGEKFLTNADLCKALHISIRTLQEYRDSGVLPYIQISGKVLYKESDVLRVLEENYYPAFDRG